MNGAACLGQLILATRGKNQACPKIFLEQDKFSKMVCCSTKLCYFSTFHGPFSREIQFIIRNNQHFIFDDH